MLDLMAVSSVQGGSIPLYMHVVTRILRQLRIMQQKSNTAFKYRDFKRYLDAEDLTPSQRCPLQQRLDTLESFMSKEENHLAPSGGGKKKKPVFSAKQGSRWEPKVCHHQYKATVGLAHISYALSYPLSISSRRPVSLRGQAVLRVVINSTSTSTPSILLKLKSRASIQSIQLAPRVDGLNPSVWLQR